MAQFGATTAFRRALPFSEVTVLKEVAPYLKKSLGVMDVEILTVDEAQAKAGQPNYTASIIDGAEPGNPGVEYFNV
jgi:leucyl-tRNA synthetase